MACMSGIPRIAERDWRNELIWFIWSVLFIWLVLPDQTNQTDQINKRNKPVLALHAPNTSGQPIRRYVPKPMAASRATLSITFSCPHIPTCALQTAREHMTDIVASFGNARETYLVKRISFNPESIDGKFNRNSRATVTSAILLWIRRAKRYAALNA